MYKKLLVLSIFSCIGLFTWAQYKKMIKPVKPESSCNIDTDKDGIRDCFDICPNTPLDVLVTSKGCPLDTDADGVPDYLDKEKITPTDCQPSDSNGVGQCAKKMKK